MISKHVNSYGYVVMKPLTYRNFVAIFFSPHLWYQHGVSMLIMISKNMLI